MAIEQILGRLLPRKPERVPVACSMTIELSRGVLAWDALSLRPGGRLGRQSDAGPGEPRDDAASSARVEAVQANAVFHADCIAADETSRLQDAEVMRDRRPPKVQLSGENRRPVWVHGKTCHDLASRFVGEHLDSGGPLLPHARHGGALDLARTYTGPTTRDVPDKTRGVEA
jgi:hypothetical protein